MAVRYQRSREAQIAEVTTIQTDKSAEVMLVTDGMEVGFENVAFIFTRSPTGMKGAGERR